MANREKLIAEAKLVLEPRLYKLAYVREPNFASEEKEAYYQETRRLLDLYIRRIFEGGWEEGYEKYAALDGPRAYIGERLLGPLERAAIIAGTETPLHRYRHAHAT